MTAPDPTPYAAPTDLVTAADVAEWLDTLHQGPIDARIFGVQDAIAALDARLDRERRQACRRGALAEWRRARELVRWAGAYRNASWAWREIAPSLWRYLSRALAFRAAARAP